MHKPLVDIDINAICIPMYYLFIFFMLNLSS
jgi:hypothetical protein